MLRNTTLFYLFCTRFLRFLPYAVLWKCFSFVNFDSQVPITRPSATESSTKATESARNGRVAGESGRHHECATRRRSAAGGAAAATDNRQPGEHSEPEPCGRSVAEYRHERDAAAEQPVGHERDPGRRYGAA